MDQSAIVLLCRIAANSVEHALLAEQMLEDTYLTRVQRGRWTRCLEDHRWTASAIAEAVAPDELVAAYRRASASATPGDGAADILRAELGRRGLDP